MEAAGKVGFAHAWIGLKSSLASTFLLNLPRQWLYLLTMGVKKKKKKKAVKLKVIKELSNDNWNYSGNGLKLLQVP